MSTTDQKNGDSDLPTLFLIHGAYHADPSYWDAFRTSLLRLCPDLIILQSSWPSNNCAIPPTVGMHDDAAHFRDLITKEVDDGKEIVVFMHSMGGLIGTEACHGLDIEKRRAKSLRGGVKKLIYLTAFVLKEGDSYMSVAGDLAITQEGDIHDNGTVTIKPSSQPMFYSDLDSETAASWCKRLQYMPIQVFTQPLTHASWRDIPSTYIYCEQDIVLMPQSQHRMVEAAEKELQASKIPRKFETVSLPASHSPFLSMPDRLAECTLRIIRD